MLLGAAVDQLAARFAQPLHRKRRARAVPKQPLQARAVVRCNANAGVYRETAVLVAQHLFGLETLGTSTAWLIQLSEALSMRPAPFIHKHLKQLNANTQQVQEQSIISLGFRSYVECQLGMH